jgi:hypothetical protein
VAPKADATRRRRRLRPRARIIQTDDAPTTTAPVDDGVVVDAAARGVGAKTHPSSPPLFCSIPSTLPLFCIGLDLSNEKREKRGGREKCSSTLPRHSMLPETYVKAQLFSSLS